MNNVRLTSPSMTTTNPHASSNKQVDTVALLLKQTIAPAQLTQVSYDDEDERKKTFVLFIDYLCRVFLSFLQKYVKLILDKRARSNGIQSTFLFARLFRHVWKIQRNIIWNKYVANRV